MKAAAGVSQARWASPRSSYGGSKLPTKCKRHGDWHPAATGVYSLPPAESGIGVPISRTAL